jgi:restriction system protein
MGLLGYEESLCGNSKWRLNAVAIPKYSEFFRSLLQYAGDAQEHTLSDAYAHLAKIHRLTAHDLEEILPSGRQSTFENRVSWALTYLKKAGLMESPRRGRFRITSNGLQLIQTNPPAITLDDLRKCPGFAQFEGSGLSRTEPDPPEQPETPEENLEASYQAIRRSLAQELLDRLKQSSPRFFERAVVDLLLSMGYGGSRADAGQAVGRTRDEGIDGVIKEDRLGLDAIYIQAKRWDGVVGRPVVQSFVGSLDGQKSQKGVLITTSWFSDEALDYVTKIGKRVVLIDGEQLSNLMIDHGVGVTEIANYTLKKLDTDYFDES